MCPGLARMSLGIATVLMMVCSCSVRESSVMRLVPVESCAILVADWASLRRDSDLRRLIKVDHFETLLKRLQIESESVETLTIFSAITSQTMSGFLLRGSFDQEKVAAALHSNGWRDEVLTNHRIYVNRTDYLAMPTRNVLFAGTRDAALAVFRAKKNAQESIVSSAAFKKIGGGKLVQGKPLKAVLLIPQGTLDMADAALAATSVALSLFDLGGIGQLLKAVNVAGGFAFSLDHATDKKYEVELSVLMRNEEAAVFVSGSLNAMKGISELAASDKRDLEGLRVLQKMKVDRRQEVLTVMMEVPSTTLFPPLNR